MNTPTISLIPEKMKSNFKLGRLENNNVKRGDERSSLMKFYSYTFLSNQC